MAEIKPKNATSFVNQFSRFGGTRLSRGTAVEEARKLFQKLVSSRINRSPFPIQKNVFAVAALPGGKLLMSDGKIRLSPATKKFQKTKSQEEEIFVGPGEKPRAGATREDIALQIAIPANRIGTAEDRVFAFTNYLNNLLRPNLGAPVETGLPAFLPSPKDVQPFYRPSVLANLPPLIRKTTSAFEAGQPRFIDNTQKIQKELTQRFLAQFARGERPAAYASLGGLGRTPLIAKQDAAAFRIPTAQNARYAAISRASRPETRVIL